MIKIERGSQRLSLHAGSTTIVLDKEANKAALQRKLLFWARKPVERHLPMITQVRVDTGIDPASRAEMHSLVLLLSEGGGWALSARDKRDATAAAAAVRDFLSLPG
jgi:hypothetical protein